MADNDFYSSLTNYSGVTPADTTLITADTDDPTNFKDRETESKDSSQERW